jgi:hypothetical protein
MFPARAQVTHIKVMYKTRRAQRWTASKLDSWCEGCSALFMGNSLALAAMIQDAGHALGIRGCIRGVAS